MSEGVRKAEWPPKTSGEFPRIAKLPPYVFAQVNEEKREKVASGADVIDLGMGNPDIPTPSHIVEELLSHAVEGQHIGHAVAPGSKASLRGVQQRSNPAFFSPQEWIASLRSR